MQSLLNKNIISLKLKLNLYLISLSTFFFFLHFRKTWIRSIQCGTLTTSSQQRITMQPVAFMTLHDVLSHSCGILRILSFHTATSVPANGHACSFQPSLVMKTYLTSIALEFINCALLAYCRCWHFSHIEAMIQCQYLTIH